MKKLLLTSLLTLNCFLLNAQDYEWALTAGTTPRSNPSAIRQDLNSDTYFSYGIDSFTTHIGNIIEKRAAANQQMIWQKQIDGYVTVTDLEINSSNHAVVVGYFTDAITVDTIVLNAVPFNVTGFILELDENGNIIMSNTLMPATGLDFQTKDLFIAADGNLYLTSDISFSLGFCAFHKLNPQGQFVFNEFNNDFGIRSFSHIMTDADGNMFLSGTCSNLASFDGIPANPNFSYQNFLVKYDSSFNAQWLVSRNYITFDDNNSLATDGQHLYWAFDDFSTNSDTAKILKVDFTGQVLSEVAAPMGNSFFPSLIYSMDNTGNSVLVLNTFTRLWVYRYDQNFNITWSDTVFAQMSGFPLPADLRCYDNVFYLSSLYLNDTLDLNNFTLLNPNAAANYRSDVFAAKWSIAPTSFEEISSDNKQPKVFPNPFRDMISLKNLDDTYTSATVYDAAQRLVLQHDLKKVTELQLNLGDLNNGVYILVLKNSRGSSSNYKIIKVIK